MIPLKTWRRFASLSALVILQLIILYYTQLISGKLTLKSYYTLTISSLVVFLVHMKFRSFLEARYEAHNIFERGNVPSVSNKHPISGNLFEMIVPCDNIKIQQSYHQKLGKTYGLFYGPDPWLLSTDPELLQRVFSQEVDRTQLRMPFLTEFSKSLAQTQGDQWRHQRRTLNPFFTCHQMKKDNVFEEVERTCGNFIEALSSLAPNELNERIMDVNYQFKKFSLEVILRVAYGVEGGVEMSPWSRNKLIDAIHGASLEVRSWLVWACICLGRLERLVGQLAKFTKIGVYLGYVHKIIELSLHERRLANSNSTPERESQRDRKMIDTIIECIDQKRMDLESIRSNLFFLLLAGFETTANTLTSLFWLLAEHPEVQEKLRQSIMLEGERSKYLDYTIQEALRLFPAVPGAVGRLLSEDIHHKGMRLFKGTTLVASIYAMQRDKELWGQDADSFRPERFEPKQAEGKLLPAQFFAFGWGQRYCLGFNLAMTELRALTARLLTRFTVCRCAETPETLEFISPNLIHMILEGEIKLKFVELRKS